MTQLSVRARERCDLRADDAYYQKLVDRLGKMRR